jgi:SAM-dependent methyltransferase
MNKRTEELYQRLSERYASGDVPWDDSLPPPEIIEHVAGLPAQRALDLGCGYGRATIYLASLGWDVDGVDFIPEAIAGAALRTREAGVYARFHVCQVTDLGFLAGAYDLAIDVGCCHNMDEEDLRKYRDHLQRLIRPNGEFLLFARMRDEDGEPSNGPGGIRRNTVEAVFAEHFELERMELGVTDVPGQTTWRSAWFWFRRLH